MSLKDKQGDRESKQNSLEKLAENLGTGIVRRCCISNA